MCHCNDSVIEKEICGWKTQKTKVKLIKQVYKVPLPFWGNISHPATCVIVTRCDIQLEKIERILFSEGRGGR